MRVLLRSRIPEIAVALPLQTRGALMAGAEQIAAEARARAPVAAETLHFKGGDVEPGHLRDSIKANTGIIDKGFGDEEAIGVEAAWYYRFAEFGTARQAAQPFLIPAAEAKRHAVEAEVAAMLKAL